ncbi:MAG: hypothetical protein JXB47_16670 [Anaerolineae bacterium]|nr:hypothetical protein [Anaerolineae bacterium]
MVELLVAMGAIVFTWAILGLIFTGIGMLVWRILGWGVHTFIDVLTSFWLGWAFTILVLQLWHLPFPVNDAAFVCISLIGILGLAWNRRTLWRFIQRLRRRWYWMLAVVALLFMLLLANRALDIPRINDNSFYQLHTMRWIATYPVVPGLGNLHDRLAFNSSHYLYVAMLDVGPWHGRSYHIANGLLLCAFFAQILWSGFKFFTYGGRYKYYYLFNFLFLMPALHCVLARHNEVSSIGNDLPIFILGFVIASKFLMFFDHRIKLSAEEASYTVVFITIIAVTGITVKLSFAALAGTTAALALAIWFFRYGRGRSAELTKLLAKLAVYALLLLIPWMIHGVILSGYIAYPSTIGAVSVEWQVPPEVAIAQHNWIRSYALNPDGEVEEVLSGMSWLRPWLLSITKRYYVTLLPLAFAALAVLYGSRKRNQEQAKIPWICWLFFVPAIAGVLFWFLMAPSARFAGSLFWVIGAGAAALIMPCFTRVTRRLATLTSLALLIVLIPVLVYYYEIILIEPGEDHGFHPLPAPELSTFVTDSGLVIHLAKDGEIDCWDGPLPCTPYPNPGLRLRDANDMSQGFIVDLAVEDQPAQASAGAKP